MSKTYQTKRRHARQAAEDVAVPHTVTMEHIAASMKDGLLALAVQSGLAVMFALLEEDVSALCGPRGKHNPDRSAVRHGHDTGSVVLGGRRLPIRRPRVRTADGTGEISIPAYELFSCIEILDEMALGKMLGKLSTRRYRLGLEPVGTSVEQSCTGTSKSAISRRFVAATEHALAEMMSADLSGLDLAALMLDGVHFGEHTCIVALGIGIDGHLVPAGAGGGLHRERHAGS